MAKFVIKRDGTKESFDGEKLKKSVEVAAMSAGIPMVRTKALLDKVLNAAFDLANSKEEITTSELGECVFGEIQKTEPEVAGVWKRYEEEKAGSQTNPFVSRGNNYI